MVMITGGVNQAAVVPPHWFYSQHLFVLNSPFQLQRIVNYTPSMEYFKVYLNATTQGLSQYLDFYPPDLH